jgi:predicted ATPase with chaperone activity
LIVTLRDEPQKQSPQSIHSLSMQKLVGRYIKREGPRKNVSRRPYLLADRGVLLIEVKSHFLKEKLR